jgi:uncharacterized ubiquitin-like protein YukD
LHGTFEGTGCSYQAFLKAKNFIAVISLWQTKLINVLERTRNNQKINPKNHIFAGSFETIINIGIAKYYSKKI